MAYPLVGGVEQVDGNTGVKDHAAHEHEERQGHKVVVGGGGVGSGAHGGEGRNDVAGHGHHAHGTDDAHGPGDGHADEQEQEQQAEGYEAEDEVGNFVGAFTIPERQIGQGEGKGDAEDEGNVVSAGKALHGFAQELEQRDDGGNAETHDGHPVIEFQRNIQFHGLSAELAQECVVALSGEQHHDAQHQRGDGHVAPALQARGHAVIDEVDHHMTVMQLQNGHEGKRREGQKIFLQFQRTGNAESEHTAAYVHGNEHGQDGHGHIAQPADLGRAFFEKVICALKSGRKRNLFCHGNLGFSRTAPARSAHRRNKPETVLTTHIRTGGDT